MKEDNLRELDLKASTATLSLRSQQNQSATYIEAGHTS